MTDPIAVLITSLFVAGVLLIFLGMHGARRPGHALERRQRWRDWMTRAGVGRMSLGQLLALCLGIATLTGASLLALTHAVWLVLILAVFTGYLPVALLEGRHKRRVRERREVWPDAIDNLVSAVRAGMSLPDAVSALAERGPEALRESFAHFAGAYAASGRFGEALDLVKEELADPAADRVFEALRVTREVGGSDLGRTLRTLSAFLRDEQRVRRELEARQSWVIVAARLAFATPWFVLLLLATKPEAVAAYQRPAGVVVIVVGAALATAGYRLMLRIGRLPTEERVLR
jgi:tight adherence protein B